MQGRSHRHGRRLEAWARGQVWAGLTPWCVCGGGAGGVEIEPNLGRVGLYGEWRVSLVELELLTLEESLPGEGVSLLGLPRTEGTGSSQPLRFPKVMRALRM